MATLRVMVKGAQNLPKPDTLGTCDPYAVVSIGPQKRQTKVVNNCHEPQWEEDLEFRLSLPVGDQSLKVEVMSFDRYVDHDYIGAAILSLSEVWDVMNKAGGEAVEHPLPLRNLRDPSSPGVHGADQSPAVVTLAISLASHPSNHDADSHADGVQQFSPEAGPGRVGSSGAPPSITGSDNDEGASAAAVHATDGAKKAEESGGDGFGEGGFGLEADLGAGGFGDGGFSDGGFGGDGFGAGLGGDAGGFGVGFGETAAGASGDGFGSGGFGESGFGEDAAGGFETSGFGDTNGAGASEGGDKGGVHAGAEGHAETAAAGRADAKQGAHAHGAEEGEAAKAKETPAAAARQAEAASGDGHAEKAAAREDDDEWGADDGAGKAKLTIKIKSKEEIEADAKVAARPVLLPVQTSPDQPLRAGPVTAAVTALTALRCTRPVPGHRPVGAAWWTLMWR
jgi:hypothetical protein